MKYENVIPNFMDILYREDIQRFVDLEEVRDACHGNQIASKNQAIEAYNSIHCENNNILYVASWFGMFTNYLLAKYSHQKIHITEIEKDVRLSSISNELNFDYIDHHQHYTCDINLFDRLNNYETFINLSCEHMSNEWYNKIPNGSKVLIQSNNFDKIDDHINCVTDIVDMKSKYPMQQILYSNTLKLNLYNRLTLAGIK